MIRLKHSMLVHHHAGKVALHDVQAALQGAIELEHSTIPLYLYAMYSLDPKRNGEIVSILRSAVIEEMLHMVLSANVLNAIGGAPRITGREFIPTYPGTLPGGVEGQMTVQLRPFSMEQLMAFIEIEEPRDPIGTLAENGPGEVGSCTIGEFYLSIESAISLLPDKAFSGSPARQIGPDLMWGSVTVTDKASAIEAINTIIEQGEGTTTSPEEVHSVGGDDYAHYYRFMQVHQGRRIVRCEAPDDDSPNFAYAGEAVVFDPAGVFPIDDNPKATDYPEGTEARRLVDTFNETYTSLLGTLNLLVNGHAEQATFAVALSQMESIEAQAHAMMHSSEGAISPTFEYRGS